MNRRVRVFGLSLVIVLAACTGGDDSSQTGSDTEQGSTSTGFSATDPSTTGSTAATDPTTADPADPIDPVDGDTDGIVTVVGSVPIEDAADIAEALAVFGNERNVRVQFVATESLADADIALLATPRQVTELVSAGRLVALPDQVRSSWPATFDDLGRVDGTRYALPTGVSVESLVWYRSDLFAERGYEVPTSWDDLEALTRAMVENGDTPFCLGTEQSSATGAVFHDWVEDLAIRFLGPDFIDRWIDHEVAFDQAEIKEVWAEVLEFWTRPGMVRDAGGSVDDGEVTAEALVNGDCLMNKRSDSPAAQLEPDDDTPPLAVFYLPSVKGDRPLTVRSINAVALTDDPQVWEVMEYLSAGAYADRRLSAANDAGRTNSFLSAAQDHNRFGLSPSEIEILDIVTSADSIRNDASDSMPASVNPLIDSAAEAVVAGRSSIADATQSVEQAWPD